MCQMFFVISNSSAILQFSFSITFYKEKLLLTNKLSKEYLGEEKV